MTLITDPLIALASWLAAGFVTAWVFIAAAVVVGLACQGFTFARRVVAGAIEHGRKRG